MISLEKRTENAETALVNMLKKEQAKGNDLGEISAQVILAIDYSASMGGRYANGEVQELVERALALALAGLDDDGEIQVFFFHHDVFKPVTVTKDNYKTVVSDFERSNAMGGTDYLPCIKKILKTVTGTSSVFKKGKPMAHPDNPPVFVLFITDGQTGNQDKIKHEIFHAADKPVFWQFLGLGYTPAFLKDLDDMPGRKVDNVDVTDLNNSSALSDDEFYELIVGEEFFPLWWPAAKTAGVLN